jgi:hypothetical protein
MSVVGAILRMTVLLLVLSTLFFTGMFVFAFVACLLLGLGIFEWLKRNRIMASDDPLEGRVEMPHNRDEPEETVFETRIIEAEYTELNRGGADTRN